MSLGVISAMTAGGADANAGMASTTGGEALPGEFATLLFGELQNLLVSVPDKANEKVDPANLELSTLIDPASIASLTGNPQFQPEPTIRGSSIFPASDRTGKSNSENVLAIIEGKAGTLPPELDSATGAKAGFGVFEKISLATNNTANNAVSIGGAAIIAGELAPQETIASVLSNTTGSPSIGRQAPEVQALHQQNVSTPLRDASWPQQFSERIVWMVRNDQQTAQININPPQLGPVQITLNLSGDQASLAFASPHSEVRQAIESALPQLKELLSSAGINLGQTNIGANLSQNPDNHSGSANENRLANENAILPANDNSASTSASTVLQRGRGLVDLFA